MEIDIILYTFVEKLFTMKFLKLLKLIIWRNPVKMCIFATIGILITILWQYDPAEKVKVDKYIRITNTRVYIEMGKQYELLSDTDVHYKDGYAYYDEFTTGTILVIAIIVLVIIFFILTLSDDDDHNFDIISCRTAVRMKDVSITSIGNGEYAYLIDKKTITVSGNPNLHPSILENYVLNYIRHPERYYIYTTREDIRQDILNDIIYN